MKNIHQMNLADWEQLDVGELGKLMGKHEKEIVKIREAQMVFAKNHGAIFDTFENKHPDAMIIREMSKL